MCGRYTLTLDKSSIERRFGARFFTAQADYEPTYNAAPSQLLPIIRTYSPERIEYARWGFVPEGWRSSRLRPQINARFETAHEKPIFRDSFGGRHCMILADSFYEWKTTASGKQPYRIMLKSGEPFAMAGIYARQEPLRLGEAEENPVSFAILTTTANALMQEVHERMPVILPLGHEKGWLPPQPSGLIVTPPFPSELLMMYPVTTKLNKVSFNEPEAIAPIEPIIKLTL